MTIYSRKTFIYKYTNTYIHTLLKKGLQINIAPIVKFLITTEKNLRVKRRELRNSGEKDT